MKLTIQITTKQQPLGPLILANAKHISTGSAKSAIVLSSAKLSNT